MAEKLIETTWKVYSNRMVKFQDLPYGSELRMFDSEGRKKYSNLKVKRRRVIAKVVDRLEDGDTVKTLIELVASLLTMDIAARKYRIALYGPDGVRVENNTHLGTVRALTPKPTEAELERQANEEAFIEEQKSIATSAIAELEYLVDDPTTTTCAAFVRALTERYGREAVMAALA